MDAQLGSMHFACAIITFIKFLHLNSAHLLLVDSIEYGTGSSWSYIALSLEPASRSSIGTSCPADTDLFPVHVRHEQIQYELVPPGWYRYICHASSDFLWVVVKCSRQKIFFGC